MNKLLIIFIVVIVLVLGAIIVFSNQNKTTVPFEEKTASEGGKAEGYLGKVLAGNSSPFLEFKKKDYEKALLSRKTIFLDFYANWCPICRAEEPIIKESFDSLIEDKIIGFRVNFNDTDTDNDEKQLAKEFNIPYQHTKIFLKNGQEVARSVDQWDKERLLKEFKNF